MSMKRSIRGKSNHGSILRQPCRYYLKGTCTQTSCEYWHPRECQMKRVVRLDTSVCSHITRLSMNNQTKGRRKSNFPKRRESDDKNAVAIVKVYHNWVVYHKIQMHSFLKVENLGETRCRKSWNLSKGYDSQSLRYVMRVSGKRTDHRLENTSQTSSSAKSLRCEI